MHAPYLPYIAYADDDPDDRELFTGMLRHLAVPIVPMFFNDGLHLIQHLEKLAPSDPLPRCVVLDLNMPMWDGIRTLQTLRSQHRYRQLPIVIFTTSSAARDRDRCLQLGANDFLIKPCNREEEAALAIRLRPYIA